MIPTEYLISLIAVMTLATVLTRAGAFFLPKQWANHPMIQKIGRVLPMAILTLLVMYTLKDQAIVLKPYGIPALVSLSAVVLVHLWKRNALASIITGTGLYMGLNFIFAGV